MKIHGQCHCGAITFEGQADPADTMLCHCTDCQQITGTAFRVSVPVRASSFVLRSGVPTEYVKVGASGTARTQAFCAVCGTALYGSAAAPAPKPVFIVRVGTLHERDLFIPQQQIWTRSAQPWTQTGLGHVPASPMESGS